MRTDTPQLPFIAMTNLSPSLFRRVLLYAAFSLGVAFSGALHFWKDAVTLGKSEASV